jgi:hypothetical protein
MGVAPSFVKHVWICVCRDYVETLHLYVYLNSALGNIYAYATNRKIHTDTVYYHILIILGVS